MGNRIILWLLSTTFIVFSLTTMVEAEEKNGDRKTVADQYEDQPSSDKKEKGMEQEEKDASLTTSKTVWTFVKVILVLALVIALIYLLLRFIKKRTKSFTERQTIQGIGGVQVGANRSVQLVKVGERVFVLGVGESISLIKEIEDTDEIQQLEDTGEQDDVIDHSFSKFNDWLQKTKETKRSKSNFTTILENNLKQMKQEHKETIDQVIRNKEHEK